MEEVIREHYEGGDVKKADVADAVELAKDLNELLDRYSNFHFFLVGDSLGLYGERDVRMDAVYAMAWAGHCAVSAQDVRTQTAKSDRSRRATKKEGHETK